MSNDITTDHFDASVEKSAEILLKTKSYLQEHCQGLIPESSFEAYYRPFEQLVAENRGKVTNKNLLDMFKISIAHRIPIGKDYDMLYCIPYEIKGKNILQAQFTVHAYRLKFREVAGLDVRVETYTQKELDHYWSHGGREGSIPMSVEDVDFRVMKPGTHNYINVVAVRATSYQVKDGSFFQTKTYDNEFLFRNMNIDRKVKKSFKPQEHFWLKWGREMVVKTAIKKFIKESFIDTVREGGAGLGAMIRSEYEADYGDHDTTPNVPTNYYVANRRKPVMNPMAAKFAEESA